MRYFVFWFGKYEGSGLESFDARDKAESFVVWKLAEECQCEVVYGRPVKIVPVKVVDSVRLED